MLGAHVRSRAHARRFRARIWWGSGERAALRGGHRRGHAARAAACARQPPRRLAGGRARDGAPPPTHVPPSTLAALAPHAEVVDDPLHGSRRRRARPIPISCAAVAATRSRRPISVLRPHTAESVAPLVAACAEHDVALVPRGGGTSLSGGVDTDDRGGCATLCVLDLRALARVLEVDPVSRRVIAEPGVSGPALEQALRGLGLEVPHHPESFRHSTVGGWVATGALGPLLRGAHLATPVGIIETGGGPEASGGPDLLATAAGGEGALGIVTRAELSCRGRPEAQAGRALASAILQRVSWRSGGSRRTARSPSCASSRTRTTICCSPRRASAARRLRGRLRPRDGALLVLGTSGRHGAAARAPAGCAGRLLRRRAARPRRRACAAARPARLRRPARARRRHRRGLPGRSPRRRVHLACAPRRT